MTVSTPPVIRTYFDAGAARDVDALAACFSIDLQYRFALAGNLICELQIAP